MNSRKETCLGCRSITSRENRLLYKKICDTGEDTTDSSYLSPNASSTFDGRDPQIFRNCEKLTRFFQTNDNYRESLIVIDGLRDDILDAFEIGCKMMITTQNLKLTSKFKPTVIEVDSNLSEEESLTLIASAVMCQVEELPRASKKLHHHLKDGSPLLMAMLGGLLETERKLLKLEDRRWEDFVTKFKKDNTNMIQKLLKSSSKNNSPSVIGRCILNSLDSDLKTYETLAILPHNVKITKESLGTIINMPESKVEDFIDNLKSKCLIIEHYNETLEKYQYEIHDLIMEHLKSVHKPNQLSKLHTNLIARYMESCPNGDLVNLQDDGYIFHQIAYHLLETDDNNRMWDWFNTLFTNLTFIGNKIRAAGPSEIIMDFNQHADRIVKSHSDRDLLAELRSFVLSHGSDLHHYPHTDIIQTILQYTREGLLYRMALQQAKHHTNKPALYFQFQRSDETSNPKYKLDEPITCVRFWLGLFFVGHKSGMISMWSLSSDSKLKSFRGHSEPVKSITINRKSPYLMASTSDEALKIWHIQDSYNEMEYVNGNKNQVQVQSCDVNCPSKDDYGKCGNVSWGNIRENDLLLMDTNPGKMVLLYNSKGNVLKEIQYSENVIITYSTLSQDDSLVMLAYQSDDAKQFGVYIYCADKSDILMSFVVNASIIGLSTILGDDKSILVFTSDYVEKHSWSQLKPILMDGTTNIKENFKHTKIVPQNFDSKCKYLSASMAEDHSCIFLSTNDCRILVYSLENNMTVSERLFSELQHPRGNIIHLDNFLHETDELYNNHILITASVENDFTLTLWSIPTTPVSMDSHKKKPKNMSSMFDCIFDRNVSSSPLPADSPLHSATLPSLRRAGTFANSTENSSKVVIRKTTSLDKYALRPLNLQKCNLGPIPLIAVVSSDYKNIQFLRGKNEFAETLDSSVSITAIALSPSGHFLVYGFQDGVVVKLDLKSRKSKKIMELNEHITYLEFVDEFILVAAGKDSGLLVYKHSNTSEDECATLMVMLSKRGLGSQDLINDFNSENRRKKSISSFDSSPPMSISSSTGSQPDSPQNSFKASLYGSLMKTSPIVKSFWIKSIGLLCVSRNCDVRLWSIDNREPELLYILITNQKNFYVSSVALQSNKLLLLCSATGNFMAYHLKLSCCGTFSAELAFQDHADFNITSCDITDDCKVLALGLSSGNIELWNIQNKRYITYISFHKSPVRCVKFSPCPSKYGAEPSSPFALKSFDFSFANTNSANVNGSSSSSNGPPLVLVSLAGQIAWWDITHILSYTMPAKRYSSGSSFNILTPKVNLSTPKNTQMTDSGILQKSFENNIFNFENIEWAKIWQGKRCKIDGSQKGLMACIKFTGVKPLKLVMDENFSCFVTVDECGKVYIMNVLCTVNYPSKS